MRVVRVYVDPPDVETMGRLRARLGDDDDVRFVDATGTAVEVLLDGDDEDAVREGEVRAAVLEEVNRVDDPLVELAARVALLEAIVEAAFPNRIAQMREGAAQRPAPSPRSG
jgi:hypothetical protein